MNFASGRKLFAPSDDPFFTVVGDQIEGSYLPANASPGNTSVNTSTPGAVVAVTTGGITINLLFDAAAMAAPASFRAGIQQAATILSSTIFDHITVNLKIDYSGSGGGAAAGPDNGFFESYTSIRTDLINNATPGDSIFSTLPSGSSIQGQSNVAVWNAQLKLLGFLGANDTTTDDGSATFATDINPNLLVGVALHELTHALGRVPYGPQPDVFDLFRFTSSGVRLFSGGATAPAAYFSVDGGVTKLADYGRTSDASDFLNSGVQGPNDPFNEYYTGSTIQNLSTMDLKQLDALGFHLVAPDTQSPTLVSDNPLSIPAGATETLSSTLLSASDNISSPAQLHFTVTTAPLDGTLMLNGSATTSFTQADINNGLVSYHETAGGVTSDNFHFTVADAAGNTIGIDSFQININSTGHAIDDFNGDGTSDILWQNDNGPVSIWDMNDSAVLSNNSLGSMPSNWKVAGTGDFNGDGKADILWRDSADATAAIWDMNDGNILSSNSLGTVPSNWTVAGTGDFNGDGKADILWRNSTNNAIAIWDMNDGKILSGTSLGILPSGWTVAGTGDFNGDGKADILWRNSTNNAAAIWDMNDGNILSGNSLGIVPSNWTVAGTGDFNGDGKTDILWRNSTNNAVVIWNMNDGNILSTNSPSTMPADWTVARIGDFNGDHKADILWRNDAGSVQLWDMNDGNILASHNLGVVTTDWHIV